MYELALGFIYRKKKYRYRRFWRESFKKRFLAGKLKKRLLRGALLRRCRLPLPGRAIFVVGCFLARVNSKL